MLLLNGSREAKKNKAPKGQGRSWVQEEHAHLATLAGPAAKEGQAEPGRGVWASHVGLLTLFTGVMLVGVMAACTALRTHLFIWTVFSPKYLFAMAWGVAWHLGVSIGLGSLVSWLGGW